MNANTSLKDLIAEMEEYDANNSYKGFKIADLRKVFEAVQNKENWKEAWAAAVPSQIVEPLAVAVEFYHADTMQILGVQPVTGKVLVSGNGYQAW